MSTKSWKHPNSLQEAIEACLKSAEKKRRSIDHIASDIGLGNKWALYKWIENCRIPAVMIRPFENACGANHITRFLAHASHSLLIDIPTGRLPKTSDVQAVQENTNAALSALIAFAGGKTTAEETIGAITVAMEHLAYHRENAARSAQPELEFSGD